MSLKKGNGLYWLSLQQAQLAKQKILTTDTHICAHNTHEIKNLKSPESS